MVFLSHVHVGGSSTTAMFFFLAFQGPLGMIFWVHSLSTWPKDLSTFLRETFFHCHSRQSRSGIDGTNQDRISLKEGDGKRREKGTMMELKIQLIPTGEIILSPGKNGENYCHNCKVSSHTVVGSQARSGVRFFHSSFILVGRNWCWHSWGYRVHLPQGLCWETFTYLKNYKLLQSWLSVM